MATQVFPHTPEVYQAMFPIVEFRGHDSRHLECLEQLGEILLRYDMNDRFGVVFLHQHLIPEPDELFYQEVSDDGNGLVLRLVNRSKLDEGALPNTFSFAFDIPDNDGELSLHGLEYSPFSEELSELQFRSDDRDMLNEIREKLIEYDCQQVFGLTMRSRDYACFGDVPMMEYAGPGPRELTTYPAENGVSSGENVAETLWFWIRNQNGRFERSCLGWCPISGNNFGHPPTT